MARCALFTVKPRGYLRPLTPSLRGGIGSKPIPSSFFSGPGKQSGAEECKPDAGKLPAARFFFQNCNAKQPRQGRAGGYEWDHKSGLARGKGQQIANGGHPTKDIGGDGENGKTTSKGRSYPFPTGRHEQTNHDLDS